MKEHGILCKPFLIKAIMEGRKTQTRRIVQNQPEYNSYYAWYSYKVKRYPNIESLKEAMLKDAKYQPGDLLYIKEGYYYTNTLLSMDGQNEKTFYKLDGEELPWSGYPPKQVSWVSPMFMPKRAARTWLKVTGVRVERVQDISKEDAIAEGIEVMGKGWKDYLNKRHYTPNPVRSFWTLWDWINKNPTPHKVCGKIGYYTSYPWADDPDLGDAYRGKPMIVYPNPWVYVYTFEEVNK